MRSSYSLRVLTRAAAAASLLAGCSAGADDPSATTSTPAKTSTDAASAEATSGATTSDPEVSDAPQVVPADLANFSCVRADSGRWRAQGDVTNSASKPMAYTVTVVTVDRRDQVVGERIKTFELEPDETHRFRWPGFFRGAADDCMPRVAREPA